MKLGGSAGTDSFSKVRHTDEDQYLVLMARSQPSLG
jgi:hypothetical protein